MKTLKTLITISTFSLLAACGPDKVSFDTLESARTQGKANAEFNATVYRAAQKYDANIVAQTDSTMTPECPQGDGWASVKLIDNTNPARQVGLKCSTVSGSVGCMTDAEFKTKVYAGDDGRCQATDKVPFPLPKIAK
jgi:hypothetical protein